MKTLAISILIALGFTAQAQVDRINDPTTQDRLDQQPVIPAQTAVHQAARQANINQQNNQNVIDSENLLQDQVERSTGKEKKNPAITPPATVHPPRLADPVSAPVSTPVRTTN